MKRILLFGLAALMAITLAGPAAAQYKATMKLASTQSMDHPYMIGAQKFADLIKERTNGRIEIKLYPSNQLGKGEREMTEGIQQGAIDLLRDLHRAARLLQPLDQHPGLPLPVPRLQPRASSRISCGSS